MSEPGEIPEDWRRDLRAKITWALAFKMAALGLLWLLFFRGRT